MRQVAVLTDIHYGWPEGKDPVAYMDAALDRAVDRINDVDPDMVLVLGDLVQEAPGDAGTRERLHTVRDRLDGLDRSFHVVPGNQDVLSMTASRMVEEVGAANDRPYFSVDLDGYRLIGLDTTQRKTDMHPLGGIVGARQREWLDRQLDTDREVFIASHHLLYARDLTDSIFFDDCPELAIAADKEYILDMTERPHVRGFINGHVHEEDHRSIRGIPHLTMRSFNHMTEEPGVSGNLGVLEMRDHGFALETDYQSYGHTY